MYKLYSFLVVVSMLLVCKSEASQLNIIPQPQKIEIGKGFCNLDKKSKVLYSGNENIRKLAVDLSNFLNSTANLETTFAESKKAEKKSVFLEISSKTIEGIGSEGYILNISKESISIAANSQAGLFYGIVSLKQIVQNHEKIPVAKITDFPRFTYRGMHFDVSRHFFSKEFIKKYINYLSMYKLNTFHWHLTDGGGWRIQLDNYPRLTEIGAFRIQSDWKQFGKEGKHFTCPEAPGAYGGYYTKEDIKDVLKYAEEKNVTVIPEIEMPGHSEEVLAVYPQLGCTGKPFQNSELCIGNDTTFTFLENVLTEIIDLFPSKYIHIGGDEADKGTWKKCPKCQNRIKDNNLKDEFELQSYLVKRIEKFINSKGRKMIGWNEILEGGLSPDATVMSWQGMSGGIKAAKENHDVVMTPEVPLYFDHYQDEPETQPEAFGGYNPIKNVYSYDPIPSELSKEEAKHVLGAQANLWTEMIATESHAEYMLMPRMVALSEVVWSKKEDKSWNSFTARLKPQMNTWDKLNINYCKPSTRIDFTNEADTINKNVKLELVNDFNQKIVYTTDGSNPTINSKEYKTPILIKDSVKITAAITDGEKIISKNFSKSYGYHKAIGSKVMYNKPFNESYPAQGNNNLVDSKFGGNGYNDKIWQGFTNDVDVTLDLKEVKDISSVSANFMQLINPWIYMPDYVEVYTSLDNLEFKKVATVKNDVSKDYFLKIVKNFKASFPITKARYIKFFAKNSFDNKFLFVDEIVVY